MSDTDSNTVLAIDIGTTRTKVAFYRVAPEGGPEVVGGVHSVPTPGIRGDGTFDPRVLIGAALDLAGSALTRRGASFASSVRAVGVTSFLSHVFVDAAGGVIGPGLSWSYQPAPEALQACRDACGASGSGGYQGERPVAPELLAPRLVHLRRTHSTTAEQIRAVISLKDLFRAVLSETTLPEQLKTDYSVRDYSLLRDRHDQPVEPICDLLRQEGYPEAAALLPPAVPAHRAAGSLSPVMAQRLGLDQGIPVAAGATDGTSGMYGGGVLGEGTVVAVFGTTDVVMRAVPRSSSAAPDTGDNLSRNAAVTPGVEILGGSTAASGAVLGWMDTVVTGGEGWKSLPPGSDGVLVAPGFDGERAPWNLPGSIGSIHGLSLSHGGAHVARALREAQLYRMRRLIDLIVAGDPQVQVIAGGGNRSAELDQLRAAILPWPLLWRRDPELSLCGTAIFALAALEDHRTRRDVQGDEMVRRLVSAAAKDVDPTPPPSPELGQTYNGLFRRWSQWIDSVYGEHI